MNSTRAITGSASIYVRLSREARDSNLSLAGMIGDARRHAVTHGYEVKAVHVDDGISGAVRDRQEFVAWLEDARLGRVDALVTYHADRLTREGVNVAAMVLDVVEGKDSTTGRVVRPPVRLLSADGLDSRDEDAFRWRFVIAAEVARAERKRIQERNLATKERLKKAGRFPGGVVPYGCRVEARVDESGAAGKYLVINEEEAAVLRDAADRLMRGDSIRSVCRWLNESGHRTRAGALWQRTTLHSTLLRDPILEHVFTLAEGRALRERLKPKEHGQPIPRGGRPNKYLLAGGLAKCATCGQSMTTAGTQGRGNLRYVCIGMSKGQSTSGCATIKAEALDARIEYEFLERYGDKYGLEMRVTVEGPEGLDEAERASKAAQEALMADLTEENLRAAQDARQRLEELQSQPVTRNEEIWTTDETFGETWRAADIPGRSELLSQALAAPVVIQPGKPLNSPTGRGKVVNLERAIVVWRDEINPPE